MIAVLTALASLCGVLVAGPVSVAEDRTYGRTGDDFLPHTLPTGVDPARPLSVDSPLLRTSPARTARLAPMGAEWRATPVRVPYKTPPEPPAAHRPVTEPKTERPRTDQPKPHQPRLQQPKPQQPKVQQPKVQQPPGNKPKAPKPKVDRPVADTSTVDETKAGGAKRKIFQGWAFDRCQAPSVSTMRAWLASPYRGVGVYFGGRGRHCKNQRHLNKSWLRATKQMGWNVLPIYVGSQSPCVIANIKRKFTIGGNAWAQGRQEARDAVNQARRLGMAPGSALYLDMEAYRLGQRRCARTTLAFVRSWNREVRQRNYVPGFYSSANSGVRHMERARKAGERDLPEVMWFARWNVPPSLYGEKWLDRRAWHPNRRIHQYAGDVTERHGGRRLAIDRNRVDAPVAIIR
ncbi:DUF1906 domain-containing protein [Streptomyces buecherae]|uniref:DUF1906 domain-containing protein n=1 Tax=Streptomyces buecherae TaxID=2763006 RepID=UPI0027E310F4|nr:glycoside hydrolase domain-containing protein [Streptomyces buecherae]